MFFKTKKEAQSWKRRQPLSNKHKVVRTSYYNLKLGTTVHGWTVVLSAK